MGGHPHARVLPPCRPRRKPRPKRRRRPQPGYRMPAEWEPHAGTWLAWPHQASDWPGRHRADPVCVRRDRQTPQPGGTRPPLCRRSPAKEAATRKLLDKFHVDAANVSFWQWPTDRVWTRDSGPTFVVNDKGDKGSGRLAVQCVGQVRQPYANDDKIPGRVAKATKLPVWQPKVRGQRVVLEGGSIDVNGDGLLAHYRRMPAK